MMTNEHAKPEADSADELADDTVDSESTDDIVDPESTDDMVAVVGMAGRYPESRDLDQFWDHLVAGDDCVHRFSTEELRELGIPQDILDRPNFVPRGTRIDRFDHFDAARFGLSPREAAMTDPQARLFLETAHQALEHAGYNPFAVPGEVGVFAGCNPIDYTLLLGNPDPTDSLTAFDQMIGNDRDFLATRVSHRLGLTGPAINVQTACSTSLVAIHLAAQHLLEFQCSAALAGGVSLNFRQGVGYFYQQGMILSPDGYCRAFDNKANGTVLGQGVGVVVLKRLADAITDGDTVHAVISASAINNDGAGKASYTAPSVDGQAEVIATTHAMAGLDGSDVTYIETHGTGTNLGDPVEVAGLAKAFALSTDEKQFCAIGSVKTNVGHTDAAAGVTGFIKAVLAVRNGVIPKSLHYDEPNAAIRFDQTPFYVATETTPWTPTTTDKRRAGVSSFGIGGTNAHVIVEEPPVAFAPHWRAGTTSGEAGAPRPQLLVTSSPSADGAKANVQALAQWVAQRAATTPVPTGTSGVPDTSAAPIQPDEAATLVHGRRHYRHRAATVAGVHGPGGSAAPVITGEEVENPRLVWMFSGQGAQVPAMAQDLVDRYPVFGRELRSILAQFEPLVGPELAPLVLSGTIEPASAGGGTNAELAAAKLAETRLAQPALFAFQVAMARQLQAWGVRPDAVLGHSIGEYAAAVIAGVLSTDDGVKAVAARGRLMWSMEPGVMLSVRLGRDELAPLLPPGADLAVSNSTGASVAAGPPAEIEKLEQLLGDRGVASMRLATSHAFHSRLMAPAARQFADIIGQFALSDPQMPMLSNVTGRWLQPGEATDPHLWAHQIRNEVRFSDCLRTLAVDGIPMPFDATGSDTAPDATASTPVFVEVGPGRALSSFVSSHDGYPTKPVAVQCLGRPGAATAASAPLLAVGGLWAAGVTPDWETISGAHDTSFRRRPVPVSVLTGDRHWLPEARHVLALPTTAIGPGAGTPGAGAPSGTQSTPSGADGNTSGADLADDGLRRLAVDEWCYGRSWARSAGRALTDVDPATQRIVVLTNDSSLSQAIVDEFRRRASDVIEVRLGDETDLTGSTWTLAPADNTGTRELVGRLTGTSRRPDHVVHAWLADAVFDPADPDAVARGLDLGVNTLLSLARGLAPISQDRAVTLSVATFDSYDVIGTEHVDPVMAAVAGPIKVIPLEYSGIAARQIDLPRSPSRDEVSGLVDEVLGYEVETPMLAVRGTHRWRYQVERLAIDPSAVVGPKVGGTYVIFGGTGGVGLALAEHLAHQYQANIVLTSRSGEPQPSPDDPEATTRAQRLAAARADAAQLLVLTADAASLDDTKRVVDTTISQFGSIDGVIFTAAVADTSGAIHRRSPEAQHRSIAAKVFGAVNLAAALNGHPVDFVLLSSSIASQLYHNRFGQVGYVTSNSFAEAMAEAAPFPAKRVVTVAWDDWMDAGMSVRAAQDFSDRFASGNDGGEARGQAASSHTPGGAISLMDEIHSFTADDGIQLFNQALGVTAGTVFVSTTDLPTRVLHDVDEVNPFLSHAVGGGASGGAGASAGQADADSSGAASTDRDAVPDVAAVVLDSWAGLLGISDVNDSDDFFDLGGDSLQVARMVDRLSRDLRLDIPLDVVFDSPRFGDLVEVLERRLPIDQGDAAIAGHVDPEAGHDTPSPTEVVGPVPLSPPQRRFLARGSATPQHFNVSVLLEPAEPVTHSQLQEAVTVLTRRHSALRTSFVTEDGAELVQMVAAAEDAALVVAHEDYSATEGDARLLVEARSAQAQASFRLDTAPLASCILFDLPNSQQRIFLAAHHLISDRVSLLAMIDELGQLLGGEELSTDPTSYATWSQAMDQWAWSEAADTALERWRRAVPPQVVDLPVTADAPNTNALATGTKIALDLEASDRLLAGGGRADTRVLLAVARALHRWAASGPDFAGGGPGVAGGGPGVTGGNAAPSPDHPDAQSGNSDAPVGIDVIGYGRRDLAGVDVGRTVGFFLSYSPLWIDPHSDTPDDLAQRLDGGWTMEPVRHRFHEQASTWNLPRVLFNYVGRPIEASSPALRVVNEPKGSDTAPENVRDHEVAIMAEVTAHGQLVLTVVYGTGRVQPHEIDRLVGLLEAELTSPGFRPASVAPTAQA